MRIKIFLILGVLILSTCKKSEVKEEYNDVTLDCKFSDNILGICYYKIATSKYDELIVNDYESFKRLGDSIKTNSIGINCDTAKLPAVDFVKYTLIAKRNGGGGCSVSYIRKVLIDSINKKVIYKVSATYSGMCYMLITSMNWAYIPKISNNYKVTFQFD